MTNENKFYVYLHHRQDDGTVFYVGKGTGSRSIVTTNRPANWKKVVQEACGYFVSYYCKNISEEDALNIESTLICNPMQDWKLVNRVKRTRVISLEKSLLQEYFEYDATSPSGVRWIKSSSPRALAGSPAGYLSKNSHGYMEWQVRFRGELLKAHRIIACLLFGNFKDHLLVNHIDNDARNNLVTNLEMCTKLDNNNRQSCQTGKRLRRHNTSGCNGIYIKKIKTVEYAVIDITVYGKRFTKAFSNRKYGAEKALELAKQAGDNFKQTLLGLNKDTNKGVIE